MCGVVYVMWVFVGYEAGSGVRYEVGQDEVLCSSPVARVLGKKKGVGAMKVIVISSNG